MKEKTIEQVVKDWQVQANKQWYPAQGETPTLFQDGSHLLWCYNQTLRKHVYINCETDLEVSESELDRALGRHTW